MLVSLISPQAFASNCKEVATNCPSAIELQDWKQKGWCRVSWTTGYRIHTSRRDAHKYVALSFLSMGRCFLVARGIVLGSCFLSLFLSSFRSCFLPPFLPFFLSFFLSFLLSFYALQTQKTHALHIIIHVAAPAIFKSPPDHPSRTMTSQQKVTEDVDMELCAQGQEGDKSQTKPSGEKRKERPEDAEM